MERPGIVLAYTTLSIGFLIIGILGLVGLSFFSLGRKTIAEDLTFIKILAIIIPTGFHLAFLYYFFMFKKKALLWLYFSFGLIILFSILLRQFTSIIWTVLIGGLLIYYIRTAKVNGDLVFI